MSPERLDAHYGAELKKGDVWAIGLCAYEMLIGKRCFAKAQTQQLLRTIRAGNWSWPPNEQALPSEDAMEFVNV